MRQQDEVSTGELYRLCLDIKKSVDITNGRVTALEKDAIRIKAFWSAGVVGFAALWPYAKQKLGL